MANKIDINPKLKPLFVNLKRVEIGIFLYSKEFELFSIENNFDKQWEYYNSYVITNKGYFDSIGPHDTEDEELAFSYLMNSIYLNSNEHFNYFISIVLIKFADWHPTKLDFSYIHNSLKEFMSKQELLEFIAETRKIRDTKPDKLEISKISDIISETIDIDPKKIFIVHGHDDNAKLEIKNLLKNDFELEPVILQEKTNESLETIISKFERLAKDCSVAIVLFTPDDLSDGKYRARQNVVLELGYFLGKFRNDSTRKIIVIKNGDIEIPSDIAGVIYLEYIKGIKEIFYDLRKQFESWNLI